MRCIAVINQKGGCGKTTVAINLSACLAGLGQRTLLVDMDPQGHCAVGLAVPEDQVERNIYDVLISAHAGTKTELKSIVWQIAQNFDLAPSGIELAALEPQLAGQDRREECLRDVLAEADYDQVVVDCPPGVGLLTFNALRAADEVVIPVETGYFALHGLGRQLETLEVLQQQCRQQFRTRILATMYDVRTKLAREVLTELRKHHKEQMFRTVVNFNTRLKEAASFGQAISEYDPASKGMRDFVGLAKELIESGAARAGGQAAGVEAQLAGLAKTAEELLGRTGELVGAKAAGARQREATATVQEKIDQFYGVRQRDGTVEFAVLHPQAEEVALAGDFNGWDPARTVLERAGDKGRWSAAMPLGAGVYRYRYVVDGRWQQDPYNEWAESNPYGEMNSVVEVK